MKYFLIGLAGFALLIFMLVMYFIGSYNRMIGLQAEVQTQRAQVDTQLQRRFDLVPSLVSAVRGSMKQEQVVFKAIADARTRYAGSPANSSERVEAANQYEGALARLLVVMENYPVLQSNERVADLMVSLEGSENRISVARQRYNEIVRDYNKAIKTFPTVFFAAMMGFTEEPMFEAQQGAEAAPKIDLENL